MQQNTQTILAPNSQSSAVQKPNTRYDRAIVLGATLFYTFVYVQVYAVMGGFWDYIGLLSMAMTLDSIISLISSWRSPA